MKTLLVWIEVGTLTGRGSYEEHEAPYKDLQTERVISNRCTRDLGDGTVRDLLLKSIENPVCAGCHEFTDPHGLAFEVFGVDGDLSFVNAARSSCGLYASRKGDRSWSAIKHRSAITKTSIGMVSPAVDCAVLKDCACVF